jgi:hypothetical protein
MVVRRELNQRRAYDMRARRVRVEQMLMHGLNNMTEMAAAFDVDYTTIRNDIIAIKEDWKQHASTNIDGSVLELRVKQMEHVLHLSLIAFEKSREDETEISITTKACDYSQCMHGIIKIKEKDEEGHPTIRNAQCPRCHGTGEVEVEVRRTKGKPGDAAFLSIAKDCVKECARLQGVDPAVVTGMKKTIEREIGVNGEIREKIEELFYEGPEENVVRAMAALEKLELKETRLIETTAETTQVEEIEEPEDGGGATGA